MKKMLNVLDYILDAKNHNDIIKQYLDDKVDSKKLQTFTNHLHILIDELKFFGSFESYNSYMRFVSKQIVVHNRTI